MLILYCFYILFLNLEINSIYSLMIKILSYSGETMSILQDAPACCLPLLKFTDIYEKK